MEMLGAMSSHHLPGANWCAFGANAKPAMLKSMVFPAMLDTPIIERV